MCDLKAAGFSFQWSRRTARRLHPLAAPGTPSADAAPELKHVNALTKPRRIARRLHLLAAAGTPSELKHVCQSTN